MQTPGLTMEAPSVPVSHYKSGVTQSAEDNRPPHLIKRHRLLLRVKAAIDFTLTHSLVREQRAAKAGSRLPRIIHPPSHKVPLCTVASNKMIQLNSRRKLNFLPFPYSQTRLYNSLNYSHFYNKGIVLIIKLEEKKKI